MIGDWLLVTAVEFGVIRTDAGDAGDADADAGACGLEGPYVSGLSNTLIKATIVRISRNKDTTTTTNVTFLVIGVCFPGL